VTRRQIWAYIERGAGDQARAAELMEASTKLAGARPAALASAARFFTDVGAPGAKRAARKLYERALQRDPDHAPSLQVTCAVQPMLYPHERACIGIRAMQCAFTSAIAWSSADAGAQYGPATGLAWSHGLLHT